MRSCNMRQSETPPPYMRHGQNHHFAQHTRPEDFSVLSMFVIEGTPPSPAYIISKVSCIHVPNRTHVSRGRSVSSVFKIVVIAMTVAKEIASRLKTKLATSKT